MQRHNTIHRFMRSSKNAGFTPLPVKPSSLEQGWRAMLRNLFPKFRVLARGAGFIFLIIVVILVMETKISRADVVGIGQFSTNPTQLNPDRGDVITINGVVYCIGHGDNPPSPSVTIVIHEQLSLPVKVTLLSQKTITENSSDQFYEWSFQATWDGKSDTGQIYPSGNYTYTINVDLPNVGKDTKSGTLMVKASK